MWEGLSDLETADATVPKRSSSTKSLSVGVTPFVARGGWSRHSARYAALAAAPISKVATFWGRTRCRSDRERFRGQFRKQFEFRGLKGFRQNRRGGACAGGGGTEIHEGERIPLLA